MKNICKILCFGLIVAMLLPSLFISCSQNNDIQEKEPLIILENGVCDYTIIRPDGINSGVVKSIVALQDCIKKKFGVSVKSESDWIRKNEEVPTDTKEILIGNTNREESKKAMSELKDGCFLIKVYGKRVAIVADGEALLMDAVKYFTETYVETAKDGISLAGDLIYLSDVSKDIPVIENENGTVTLKLDKFVTVYDDSNKQKFVPEVAKAFASLTSKKYASLGATEDKTQNKYEILFGECDREDFVGTDKEFLFRDFFIGYSNGKISVSAFSIYGYESAINYLLDGYDKDGLTIPTSGIYVEHDYGNGAFAKLYKNYENPTMDGAWIVNVAHRGDTVTNKNPENSVPAYKSCVDNGIDVIETDPRKTKDGVWVICHDDSINRTTNGTGKVANLTYAQIKSYNLKTQKGGSSASLTGYVMPTLSDIIKSCKNGCLLNLDKLDPTMYQEIYDIFEKEGAVAMAMYKGSSWDATQLTAWFCDLIEEGRKLPLYSPMLYSNTESRAASFVGLTTMIETGDDQSASLLKTMLEDYNIRAMCLTAGDNSKENYTYYTNLKEVGYTGIMTDKTVFLKEFIHGK